MMQSPAETLGLVTSRSICSTRARGDKNYAVPSELGKRGMLAFAHIPTGATANKGFAIDQVKGRTVASAIALTAIGANTETGRATP
jgi:hypothetical protein